MARTDDQIFNDHNTIARGIKCLINFKFHTSALNYFVHMQEFETKVKEQRSTWQERIGETMWWNSDEEWVAVVVREEASTGIKISIASSIRNPHTKRGKFLHVCHYYWTNIGSLFDHCTQLARGRDARSFFCRNTRSYWHGRTHRKIWKVLLLTDHASRELHIMEIIQRR